MSLEKVEIKKAQDLPAELQQENDIYSGLVEVRYEKNSPVTIEVNEVEGSFGEKFQQKLKASQG